MKTIQVENDATNVITYFTMRDRTTNIIDTGVVIANLEMYYIKDQAAISANVFSQAHGAVTDAHTDGECIHVGYGVYRVDWPDAAFNGGQGERVQLILVDGDNGAFTEILSVELSPPVALADGVTHGGSTAILTLKSMTVSNPDGDGVTFESTYGDDASGFVVTGAFNGAGLLATGGDDEGSGIKAVGGGGGDGIGLHGVGTGTGSGIQGEGGNSYDGSGIQGKGGAPDGNGMELEGTNEGAGLFFGGGGLGGIEFFGDVDINSDILNRIVADTNELQTDWKDGGRLDSILDIAATDFVAALMAHTGFTAGGTMSYETLMKILAAWSAGNWRDKPTDADKQELLDADDDVTVILTQILSNSTPYKQVDIS